jgi:hypothetical protein
LDTTSILMRPCLNSLGTGTTEPLVEYQEFPLPVDEYTQEYNT